MKVITLNFDSPAHNLAADEALLNHHEEAGEGETLRFWESPSYFVVLGFSNKLSREVHEEVCRTRNIPILRRASGGGTVLQGPGCLNYTLILDTRRDPALSNISSTTRYVLERNRTALSGVLAGGLTGFPSSLVRDFRGSSPLTPSRAINGLAAPPSSTLTPSPGGNRLLDRHPLRPISLAGESDLVWNELKFSGNAQRRLRRYVMFHGTFLYDFDLSLVECFLQMPERRPEYRAGRPHKDFIGNILLKREQIRDALKKKWMVDGEMSETLLGTMERLIHERYARSDWTRKF